MDMDIDRLRKYHLALAEMVDAWRVIPRTIVAGYAYLIYWVVTEWYTKLAPYMLEGCVSQAVEDCLIQAPTNAHTALVVTVVGMAAPIMAFYVNTSKKWNGFTYWNKPNVEKPDTQLLEEKEKPLD